MSTIAVPTVTATPIVVSVPRALQLVLLAVLALFVYYLVGVDEGMTSIFGGTVAVHELVHDGRHFLGFPCH